MEEVLLEKQSSSTPIYAVTGTGHHSKNGRVKVTKSVCTFLNDWRYAFKEFSVPEDKNNYGGILGIDPSSWDRSLDGHYGKADGDSIGATDGKKDDSDILGRSGLGHGKIRIVKEADIPNKNSK